MSASRVRGAGVALLAALLAASPAAAQQVPAETVLDTVNASTPVSAYGGVAVWNSFDTASKRYRLRVYRDGRVTDVPVAPRRSPFDVDVGPDRTGQPVIVYSRCRKDEPGGLNFNGLPEWAFARGCDVHRFRLRRHRPRAGGGTIDGALGGHAQHLGAVARLLRHRRATSRPSWCGAAAISPICWARAQPAAFRAAAKSSIASGQGPRRASPTSLDLKATTMVYGWSNLESCATGEGDSGGESQAAQIWRQALGRRTRLANQCTGYGVFGPFFAGTSVRWIAPAVDTSVTLASSVLGDAGPLPAYAVGAAIDGPNLIVARGSETGPTQVVAIPRASSPASEGSGATTSAAGSAAGSVRRIFLGRLI